MKKEISILTTKITTGETHFTFPLLCESHSNALKVLANFYHSRGYKATLEGNVVTIAHPIRGFILEKYAISYDLNFAVDSDNAKRKFQIIDNIINLKLVRYMRHINAGA